MEKKLEQIKGHLIVSCQALPHEPLHSSFIMGRMARAAAEGGAMGPGNTGRILRKQKERRSSCYWNCKKRLSGQQGVYYSYHEEIDELHGGKTGDYSC